MKATLSHQKSIPSVPFGTGGMKEHGRPMGIETSTGLLGPKYSLDDITSGKQVQSHFYTAPMATFGSGPQRYHGGKEMVDKITEPSPQQYDTETLTKGMLKLSTRRNITGMKFMTGPRTYNDANERDNANRPAPGQYKPQSSIGRQVESTYENNGFFSIRGGKRDFIKQGAEQEPGPGQYIDPIKEGRNENGEVKAVLSRQKSYPSAIFGTSRQRPIDGAGRLEKRPGPNQYNVKGAMGTQVSSKYRSTPQCSFGAR